MASAYLFAMLAPHTIGIPRSRSDCEPRVRGRPCRGALNPPPHRRSKSGVQRPISAYGRGLGAQGRFLAAPSPRDRNRYACTGRRAWMTAPRSSTSLRQARTPSFSFSNEPRHIRLHSHSQPQQDAGSRTRPLRIHPAPRQHHRAWQLRHGVSRTSD